MRCGFQVFEGITILYSGSEMVAVLNLRPIHEKILALLGREYERIYILHQLWINQEKRRNKEDNMHIRT
ncbi:MAG: hypothetical protein U9O85_02720 [Euryarchaeota archaeon]|nr:hypothetical protein [Euryarchaeota archaeon]